MDLTLKPKCLCSCKCKRWKEALHSLHKSSFTSVSLVFLLCKSLLSLLLCFFVFFWKLNLSITSPHGQDTHSDTHTHTHTPLSVSCQWVCDMTDSCDTTNQLQLSKVTHCCLFVIGCCASTCRPCLLWSLQVSVCVWVCVCESGFVCWMCVLYPNVCVCRYTCSMLLYFPWVESLGCVCVCVCVCMCVCEPTCWCVFTWEM